MILLRLMFYHGIALLLWMINLLKSKHLSSTEAAALTASGIDTKLYNDAHQVSFIILSDLLFSLIIITTNITIVFDYVVDGIARRE
jgi:hypothetical protein